MDIRWEQYLFYCVDGSNCLWTWVFSSLHCCFLTQGFGAVRFCVAPCWYTISACNFQGEIFLFDRCTLVIAPMMSAGTGAYARDLSWKLTLSDSHIEWWSHEMISPFEGVIMKKWETRVMHPFPNVQQSKSWNTGWLTLVFQLIFCRQ